MPNKKISQLVNKTTILSTDLFPIGDATSGQLYKKTIAELQAAIGGAVISVNGLVGTVVLDTDDIQELATPTNKYFTDARARAAVSATSPLAFNSSTGVFSMPAATTSANGYLTSTDWNTFNGKENVLTFSSPLVRTSNTISMPAATTSVNGYLSSTDWNTFNNKQGALSLTVTGSSGASTLIGNTLNVPTYTLAGLGGITASFLSGGTGITYNSGTGVIATTITQYTDALARASLSFTAGSGAYNSTTGVITIPTNTNQLTNGASFITLGSLSGGTGISYNNTTGVITNTITQYTDALARASLSFTAGSGGYNSTTGVITIPTNNNQITNGAGYITSAALSGYVTGSGTVNYVPKFTSTSGIGNSVIQESSNLIGINVTPTRVLHLSSSGTNAAIRLDNTVSGRPFLLNYDDSQNLTFINSSDSGYIAFNTGTGASTTKMLITASGNLGLGVTPSAWSLGKAFEINSAGNSVWSYSNDNIYLTQNSTFNGGWYYGATATAAQYVLFQGKHLWMTAPSGTAGTAISFTQAMTLDASGNLFVGATNSALNATRGLLLNGGSLGDVQFRLQNNNTGTTGTDGLLISLASDNSMYVYNYENAPLNFGTNNSIRATISAAGNLLVGTTTDSGYKLDINGTGRFSSDLILSSTGNSFIVLNNTTGTTGKQWRTSSASNGNFYITQVGVVDVLTLAPTTGAATFSSSVTASTFTANDATYGALTFNGGTSNGVVGSYGTQLRLINFTASGSTLIQGNGAIDINTQGGYALTLGTSGTTRLTINSSGSVGIGTSSPSQLLTVNGEISAVTRFRVNPSTQTNQIIGDGTAFSVGGSNNLGIRNDSGSILFASGSATVNMLINTSGSIGIGTTSPAQKLDVSGGAIRATQNSTFDSENGPLIAANGTTPAKAVHIGYDATADGGFVSTIYSGVGWKKLMLQAGGGNVLVGTTTDNGEKLYVSGAIRATGTITANSDIRLKKNLERIENALEKVGQISGYTYNTIYDDKRHGGVIAQEVDEVFPEIVNKGNDGLLGVEYGNISALLIEALKELKEKNTALEARLQALEK